ncbi:hypothetical protein BH10BAC6_BH10BAC6_11860 [soil metagenome]
MYFLLFLLASLTLTAQQDAAIRSVLQRYDAWRFCMVDVHRLYWDEGMVATMNTALKPKKAFTKAYVLTTRSDSTTKPVIIAVLTQGTIEDTMRMRHDLIPPAAVFMPNDLRNAAWPEGDVGQSVLEFLQHEVEYRHLEDVSPELQDLRDYGMPWNYEPGVPFPADSVSIVSDPLKALTTIDHKILRRMVVLKDVSTKTTALVAKKSNIKPPFVVLGLPPKKGSSTPQALFVEKNGVISVIAK